MLWTPDLIALALADLAHCWCLTVAVSVPASAPLFWHEVQHGAEQAGVHMAQGVDRLLEVLSTRCAEAHDQDHAVGRGRQDCGVSDRQEGRGIQNHNVVPGAKFGEQGDKLLGAQ